MVTYSAIVNERGANMARQQQLWSYPAIIAAIGQGRLPTFGELRFLVRRIRHETVGLSDNRLRRKIIRQLTVAIVQSPKGSGKA